MGSQHQCRLSLFVCVSASWQSPGCTVVKISRQNNWVNCLYSKHCVQQRNSSCEERTCQFMSTFRMIETAGLRCVCLSEKTTTLGSSAGRVSAGNDYDFFLSVFFHLVWITNMPWTWRDYLAENKTDKCILLFDVSLVSLYIRCFYLLCTYVEEIIVWYVLCSYCIAKHFDCLWDTVEVKDIFL